MAHKHNVHDSDARFKIDAVTRVIKNGSSGKTTLIQSDHNSERFTFEVPRFVDGHDLSLCNRVQVHYINIDSTDKTKISKDVYDVADLKVSPESENVVTCSWLIDGKATMYAGTLHFSLKFKCVSDGGSVDYVWNTAIFSGISISTGIDNGEAIVGEYSDILEQWRSEIMSYIEPSKFEEAMDGLGDADICGIPVVENFSKDGTLGVMEIQRTQEEEENPGHVQVPSVGMMTAAINNAIENPPSSDIDNKYLSDFAKALVAFDESDTCGLPYIENNAVDDEKKFGRMRIDRTLEEEDNPGHVEIPSVGTMSKAIYAAIAANTGSPGAGGEVTDEQVADAVSKWLEEHPEATTTVADGSITREKLAFHAYEGTLSPNLINPDGLISARFTTVSGHRQTFAEGTSYYNSWRMTDYIDVSAHTGEQIWLTNMQGYCFYDGNKNVIPNSGYNNSTIGENGVTIGIEIPEGASYVVLSMFNATRRTFMANFGSELLAYVPYGEILFPNNVVGADNIKGQLPLDKIDTSDLLLPTIGVNLIDKSKMVKDYWITNTGTINSYVSSLSYWYVTDITVIGGETYLACCRGIVFFDKYNNVCGYDSGENNAYRKITAPVSAVYCAVNSAGYSNTPANMEHGAFLIRGDKLPDKVVNGKYYDGSVLDNKTMYKSVLHRMEDCWNPSTKTIIGLYGDSNTYGIEGNGSVRQNPECWANLLTSEIQRKLVGERYIYPFGDIGVWGCTPYVSSAMLGGAVIKVPFYGTSISMESGTVAPVPITINVSFDDGEFEECTIEEAGRYTWDGLEEGYHAITIIGPKSSNFCISRFVVNKQVEVINRAVSGQALGSIVGAVGEVKDTIEIICSGTNNRGGGTVLNEEVNLSLWEYQNRATKHIYISPIPSWDTIEEANEPWKTIPYIESFIAGREARKNCEYISLYHEIKDYCIKNNVELQSLYVEGLHLNDAGHKVVAQILCRKLGLGDLTETSQ